MDMVVLNDWIKREWGAEGVVIVIRACERSSLKGGLQVRGVSDLQVTLSFSCSALKLQFPMVLVSVLLECLVLVCS